MKQLYLIFTLIILILTTVSCQKSQSKTEHTVTNIEINETDAAIYNKIAELNKLDADAKSKIDTWKSGRLIGLDLRDLNITKLPDNIGKLTALKVLDLSKNPLKKFPDSFVELKDLEALNLNYLTIKSLPKNIGRLSNLKKIYIRGLDLNTFPKSFKDLQNLEVLHYEEWIAKKLPEEIFYLDQLKELNIFIKSKTFKHIPLKFMKFEKLEKLTISAKSISEIPVFFEKYKYLKELSISGLEAKTIPKELYNITTLEILDLSNNKLEYLPNGISKLKNLHQLDLAGNYLESLPEDLYKMKDFEKRHYKNPLYNGIRINSNFIHNVTQEQDKWLKGMAGSGWKDLQSPEDFED